MAPFEMAVPRSLAIGIGEVRQVPSLLPYFRGTTGLLADRFPHQSVPRWHAVPQAGAVSFAEKPSCTLVQQHPALVQLLDSVSICAPAVDRQPREGQTARVAEVGKAWAAPSLTSGSTNASGTSLSDLPEEASTERAVEAAVEAPAAVADPLVVGGCGLEDEARAGVQDAAAPPAQSATFGGTRPLRCPFSESERAAQSYYARSRQLEESCRMLIGENLKLKADLEVAVVRHQRTRELNQRLLEELREERGQRAGAVAQAEQLAKEAESLRHEQAAPPPRRPRAGRRQSLAAALEACPEPPPGLTAEGTAADGEELGAADGDAEDSPCSCGAGHRWGCPRHRVYPSTLLLAHRALREVIDRGAPGLSTDIPVLPPLQIGLQPVSRLQGCC